MCWQRNAAATAGIPISRKPSKIAGKSLAFLFAVAEERYAFGSPGPDDCADRPGAGPPPADGRDVVGAFALRAAAQPVEKTLAPARASRGGKLPSERRSGDRVRHIGCHCEGRDECRSRDPERHATPAMLPCKPPRTVRFFYCRADRVLPCASVYRNMRRALSGCSHVEWLRVLGDLLLGRSIRHMSEGGFRVRCHSSG
jgi:hypothetical protein